MPQFMMLLRGRPDWAQGLSPEQMQAILGRHRAWGEKLRAQGRMVGGSKLKDGEGRMVRLNGSKPVITDGPFTESKEVIGGYYAIEADDYDHAVETAKDCPHLDYGTIEVRQIDRV